MIRITNSGRPTGPTRCCARSGRGSGRVVPARCARWLYWSKFTGPDGTTVRGFRPGYSTHSESPTGLDDCWATAQLIDGPDFLFIPKFKWRCDEEYVADIASEMFATFSIGPFAR
jgi:hypothetical protein